MSELNDKWVKQSKEMLKNADELCGVNSNNKVFASVDSVGAIQAYVFGEEGIVSVVPCYDHQYAGKFATKLIYPQLEEILNAYAQENGLDTSQVNFIDDDFISYALEMFRTKNAEIIWNGSYSGYKGFIYDSLQEAINSMYTSDVFCDIPKSKSNTRK